MCGCGVAMAVSAPLLVILAVQAVPTLLSCLAFISSFSPLSLFVESVPFSVLFVTLSVLTSVCSWCWSPLNDGSPPADENGAAKCSSTGSGVSIDCSHASSKLSNRSWWSDSEGPRGLQLAMLFLMWALLFLLLCMPPMANAEVGTVQAETEHLTPLGDLPEIVSSSEKIIREVTSKDSNVLEAVSHNSESGHEEHVNSGPAPNNPVEEQMSQQSSFDSSGSAEQLSSPEAHSPAAAPPPGGKVELQSCRALIRTGELVECGAGASPALEVGFSDVRDCSKETPPALEGLNSIPAPEAPPVFPSQLDFGMQPLHQRQVAFLTIMNSCNGSRLSLLAAKSDNRQFFVTGFSAKFVAPGTTLTFPVCYLPQYVGAAKGSITIETGVDPLVVQLRGQGEESLYKMHVRVHGKSPYVISLFNPYNETLFVEEVVVLQEKQAEFKQAFLDRVSESTTLDDDIVIEAEECSSSGGSSSCSSRHDAGSESEKSSVQKKHGVLMGKGETWELPGQTAKDIVAFNIFLEQGEIFRGTFQIRVSGAPVEAGKGATLVYPFSSRVSHPSPVLSSPDTLDFGMVLGDQASSRSLVLKNFGEQLVQVEAIYEYPGDPRIVIDYERGRILQPGLKTEVANITFNGQSHAYESSAACRSSPKIIVRTNSTVGHWIEVAYKAIIFHGIDAPPTMAYVTGSTGRPDGDLGESHTGQGFTDLLMDYKLFMGFLICGLILFAALVFFQVVVQDAELPTISGDLGKGGCHRRSNSRVSPFIKKRDKILKMWGWGALATVVDGIWAAFGSTLWSKDCSTSNPDYSLPRSVTPAPQTPAAQTPAPSQAALPSPKSTAAAAATTGGAGASSGSGAPQASGGRKGSSDRKNNGAAKADQTKGGAGGLPVTTREPTHHSPSVKQPKSSKFLRSENASTKHSNLVENSSSVDADDVVKDGSVAAPPQELDPIETIAPALSPGPATIDPSFIKESSKNTTSSTFSSDPVAQKTQPASSPRAPPVERERRRRKTKCARQDVAANLGTTSPASPASPVTPSASAWPVSPPSPAKKSDQSTASLSPRSSGSVDLADPAPLPKLKVKLLNSLRATKPAPAISGTESPRRNGVASMPLQQPKVQGKAVDQRKQSPLEKGASKRSNFSEWAAVARKKTPSTGYNHSKGLEVTDGSQSYRVNRNSHRGGGNVFALPEEGPGACFTTSASFPRLNPRQVGGWVSKPPYEFGIGERIDSFDTCVVPPPAIAPALRAPGAKITKQSAAASDPGWTSLGFTASPELLDGHVDRELIPGAPWRASSSLSGQSSGELVYDIWGNHFGNLSQCSSNPESQFQPGFEKEVDPVSGFHRLLVPDHNHHSEVLFAGTGFAGDMSPTAQALYASFSGFFSEGSTLGLDDSRPGSPACVHDLPDQLYPSDVPVTAGASKLGLVAGPASSCGANVKPRVRVPYSPPMGCVAATTFSASSAGLSPLSTPTALNSSSASSVAAKNNASCSFWAHDNSKLPERVVSPTLSLT